MMQLASRSFCILIVNNGVFVVGDDDASFYRKMKNRILFGYLLLFVNTDYTVSNTVSIQHSAWPFWHLWRGFSSIHVQSMLAICQRN